MGNSLLHVSVFGGMVLLFFVLLLSWMCKRSKERKNHWTLGLLAFALLCCMFFCLVYVMSRISDNPSMIGQLSNDTIYQRVLAIAKPAEYQAHITPFVPRPKEKRRV